MIDLNIIFGIMLGAGCMFVLAPVFWHYHWHDVFVWLGVHQFFCKFFKWHYWLSGNGGVGNYRRCVSCDKQEWYHFGSNNERKWIDFKEQPPSQDVIDWLVKVKEHVDDDIFITCIEDVENECSTCPKECSNVNS